MMILYKNATSVSFCVSVLMCVSSLYMYISRASLVSVVINLIRPCVQEVPINSWDRYNQICNYHRHAPAAEMPC